MERISKTMRWGLALTGIVTGAVAAVVDIGNRRELFVDHELIESLDGVSLRLHQPRNAGPAFQFDKPPLL